MKNMEDEIKKVTEREPLLQVEPDYNEQEVLLRVLDIAAEYGLSAEQLKKLLCKQTVASDELMTVEQVAILFAKSPQWIRSALKRGELREFGMAVKTEAGTYHYLIFKNKFKEYTGIKNI